MNNVKKILLSLSLLLASALAHGTAYELRWTQRDSMDVNNFTRSVVPITPSTSAVLMYNGLTTLPQMGVIGTGLLWDGTTLSATAAAQVNSDWNSVSGASQILNKPTLFSGNWSDLAGVPSTFAPSAHTHAASDITSGTLADARIPSLAISKTTGLQAALDAKLTTPTGSTSQVVLGNGTLGTLPVVPTRSFANPARSLNTAFQISSTRDAWVGYSVNISVTSALLAGQEGRVHLEYADDSGFTTNVVTVASTVNATSGVLNLTNIGPGSVTGWIPAAKYARIRTENVTGTPTYALTRTQEVQQ